MSRSLTHGCSFFVELSTLHRLTERAPTFEAGDDDLVGSFGVANRDVGQADVDGYARRAVAVRLLPPGHGAGQVGPQVPSAQTTP